MSPRLADSKRNELIANFMEGKEDPEYEVIPSKTTKGKFYITTSLYENVSNYSSSVCGTYLDVDTLKDGATHDFTMKLNIPFTDLLALQSIPYKFKFGYVVILTSMYNHGL